MRAATILKMMYWIPYIAVVNPTRNHFCAPQHRKKVSIVDFLRKGWQAASRLRDLTSNIGGTDVPSWRTFARLAGKPAEAASGIQGDYACFSS